MQPPIGTDQRCSVVERRCLPLLWQLPSNIGVLAEIPSVTWPLVSRGVAMAPFGSGHTVLDGNSTPDSPKGATMAPNRCHARDPRRHVGGSRMRRR